MEHRNFRIFSTITLGLIITSIICFDYFSFHQYKNSIIFKILPLTFMIAINTFYLLFYFNLYAFTCFCSLFFCLMGDLFLGLYENPSESKIIFMVGGTCFLIARVLLLFMFIIYPYHHIKIIRYNWKELLFFHVFFSLPYVTLGFFILFTIYDYFFFIYLILGFPIQNSYACLRIKKLDFESSYSVGFGCLGIILFNISDMLLYASMKNYLPFYVSIIADNLYWLSIFLITISIVRCSDEEKEKEICDLKE